MIGNYESIEKKLSPLLAGAGALFPLARAFTGGASRRAGFGPGAPALGAGRGENAWPGGGKFFFFFFGLRNPEISQK